MTRPLPETQEERIEKALHALQDAFDRYANLDPKDQNLGLIYDLTYLLIAQAKQPEIIAEESAALDLGDMDFYHRNYHEARQGIIEKLVDTAAEIARENPRFGSTMFKEERFTNAATSILKSVAYASVNTRADLLVQYAHRIDQETTIKTRQEEA